ncbi:MAG TPA: YkgJ family cysteine cluster protein [Brumimicrobium sp.]|nr:YkgJ family cysteine cluster protein [Brumimicrobium sp.]
MDYQEDLDIAQSKRKENKQFFKELKRIPEKKLDQMFHEEHDKVFEVVDCLSCANCCKTTSPIFRDIDIHRLSKKLRVKASDFVTEYLHLDSDGDYVLNVAPCPFLGEDNRCSVYENRPLACREYPHTNRKKMHQILPLTLKNTLVCPAVSRMVEAMRDS